VEIGIFRAIGIGSRQILILFLSRHLLLGAMGGALGFGAGVLSAVYFVAVREGVRVHAIETDISWAGLLLVSVAGAATLSLIAGWIPALLATRQDPADVLREE
jgi:ABC-type antimicrobial peptide transport system permease subunit